MSRGYRKVITGGATVAATYFWRADRMFESFPEKGEARRSYRDFNIVILCKQDVEGSRKAIFIPQGYRLIYTKQVTFDNVLTVGAWRSGVDTFFNVATLDFDDIPGALTVNSIEYVEFVGGATYVVLKRNPSLEPLANYPATASGVLNIGDNEPLNWIGTGAYFAKQYRGTDRDIFYTTTGLSTPGQDQDATLWERLWDDEDKEIIVRLVLPLLPGGYYYPSTQMADSFSRWFTVVENAVYVLAADVNNIYWIIYRNTGGSSWELIDAFDYNFLGGLSVSRLGNLFINRANTLFGYTISVLFDAADVESDLEQLYSDNGGWALLHEFDLGDVLGYVGRRAGETARISRAWVISDNVYGMYIENTQYIVDDPDQIADCVLKVEVFPSEPNVVTLVYEAGHGNVISNALVNPKQSNLLLVGEETRQLNTGDETFIKIIDMNKPLEETSVSIEESWLSGLTWVQ